MLRAIMTARVLRREKSSTPYPSRWDTSSPKSQADRSDCGGTEAFGASSALFIASFIGSFPMEGRKHEYIFHGFRRRVSIDLFKTAAANAANQKPML